MNDLTREMELQNDQKIRVKNESSIHHKPFKDMSITTIYSSLYLFDLSIYH